MMLKDMEKKYISAGAGSGKTYRITTHVAGLIKKGQLKPDQVIMTTYTKAAAQELREKSKKELAKIGLNAEAQQMEHALIGTVHSVANTFITKYWYLLGIMPDAAAMEEHEQEMFRDHSLRGLLNKEGRQFLFEYAENYQVQYKLEDHKSGINYEFWKDDLCKVLGYMQWYDIKDEQLDDSIKLTESFIECLKSNSFDIQLIAQKAIVDILDILSEMRQTPKARKQTEFLNNSKNQILNDGELNVLATIVSDRLKNTETGVAYSAAFFARKEFTLGNAEMHRKYAQLIFDLAKSWRAIYRQYKDEHHLIDFNDMEEMFYKLLDMEEVQQDIQSNYTHLFVDEFQDSNPMQVKIFQRLSTLLNATYVGDKKQAIYGFRGSDTELTSAVADSIENKETLKYSYRSVKPLVNFANKVFTKVFKTMPEDEVALYMPDKPTDGNRTEVDKPLRLWTWHEDSQLAQQIQQFILREKIEPKDIAVLARKNADLDKLADALRALHVPVCREVNDIKDSRTGRLMKALLTLVATPSNELARAELAYLTVSGYGVTKVIENRLDNMQQKDGRHSYLMDVPIVKRLLELRRFKSNADDTFSHNLLGYQSISALVESLVIELDLYGLVQSWENASAEETNLQVFIDLARQYEDSSTKVGRPATVAGFLDYFTCQKQQGAANDEGVRLFTYHKSKGLEWKVVILLSLDKDAADATNIAKQSMLGCHCHRKQLPTAENPNPPMNISLIRNIYGTSNAATSAITASMQKHELWNDVYNHEVNESARLLYVGVTRAREILILAPKEHNGAINLSWFRSVGIDDVVQTLDGSSLQDFFKNGMKFDVEHISEDDLLEWPDKTFANKHDLTSTPSSIENPLYLSPSKAGKAPHDINTINQEEQRMDVKNTNDEDAKLGDFIHQVFCCCDDGIDADQIRQLCLDYKFEKGLILEPNELLQSWNYLVETLESNYGPSVKRHHERPFRHIDDAGHIVSGYMDLIWETGNGYVVVDYKTCPGGYNLVFTPTSEHYVGRHGDQLDCYERALMAEGDKKVVARVIYYPVTRFFVEVL